MSEEYTRDLTQDEKLDLILSRLTSVEGRLTALEERQAALEAKVEERLHDTRPLWEVIHAQTEKLIEQNAQIVETLSKIESKLEVLTQDVLDVRAAQRILASRVHALEQRTS